MAEGGGVRVCSAPSTALLLLFHRGCGGCELQRVKEGSRRGGEREGGK